MKELLKIKSVFFDPRKQPLGQSQAMPITWGGFPSVMHALHPSQDEAFQLADKLATFENAI